MSSAAVRKPVDVHEALRTSKRDPVLEAIARAPISDEEETEEERRFVEEAMHGPFTPGEVVSAEIAARCPRPDA